MDLRHLLGCLVLFLAGLSLLQLNSINFRKAGMMMIWLASGVTAYFIFESIWAAFAMLGVWIFFPLWEMVFVLRQLRVPRHRKLADARAPRDEFEELSEMSQALVDLGFENLDECRLAPAQHEQYYRIFVREDGLVQATISYISQGAVGFHFVTFTSMGKDDQRWVTWDYPLTYGLIMPPNIIVFRALHCEEVADLYQAHLDFLEINGMSPDQLVAVDKEREAIRTRLVETLNQQVEYNISQGVLAPASGQDEENFCYSWRGTLYVAGQVIRDIIF